MLVLDYIIATAFKIRYARPTFLTLKVPHSDRCREGITYNGAKISTYSLNTVAEFTLNAARIKAGQVFNGVEIEVGKREVHNLLRFSAKLWTL